MLPEHKTWIPAHKTLTPAHKTWIPAHKTLTPAHKTWTPAHKTSIRPEHNASPKFLKKKPAPLDTPSPGQSRQENQHARLVSQRPRHRTIVFFRNLEIILGPSWNHFEILLASFWDPHRSLMAHHRSLMAHHRSLIAHHRSIIAHRRSLIAHHRSLMAHHRSPITHHRSLIAHH